MTALQTAFRAVLFLSAAGTAVTAAVTAAVWLLRRVGAPRAVAAALWLAVLLRLVCPGGLPVPVPQPLQAAVMRAAQAAWPQNEPSAANPDAPPANILQPGAAQLVLPQQTVPDPRSERALTGWDAAALVWLAGAVALLLRAGLQTMRLHRSVRLACRAEAPDGTLYYESDAIAAPFVLGALQPRICLPVGLDDAMRQAVLAHEKAHLRRGDPLFRAVFYLAVCLHWFNPTAWWAFGGFCRDSEAACDEAVLRALGEAAKPGYCRALLRFAAADRVSPAAVAFAPDSLAARVQSILRWRQPRRSIAVVSTLLAAMLFAACMAAPMDETPEPDVITVGGASSTAQLQPDGEADASDPPQNTVDPQPDAGSETAWVWPVPDYEFVSLWAETNPNTARQHSGVDICAPQDAPIVASADGTVLFAGWGGDLDPATLPASIGLSNGSGYGNLVLLQHAPGVYTLYAHCSTVTVAAGDAVSAGQTIAAMGTTGRSTGVHLHWELRVDGENIPPQQIFAAYAD